MMNLMLVFVIFIQAHQRFESHTFRVLSMLVSLFFLPSDFDAHKFVSGSKRVKAAVERVFGAVISSTAIHVTIPASAPLFFQQGRRDDHFRLSNLYISFAVIGSLVVRTTDAQITAYLTAHRDQLDTLTDAAIPRALNIGWSDIDAVYVYASLVLLLLL
jgi:hypothetical protein